MSFSLSASFLEKKSICTLSTDTHHINSTCIYIRIQLVYIVLQDKYHETIINIDERIYERDIQDKQRRTDAKDGKDIDRGGEEWEAKKERSVKERKEDEGNEEEE